MSDRVAHPLHLAVAALVDRELDSRRAQAAGARRGCHAVLELDAAGKPFERCLVRSAFDVDLVGLLDAVPRMREAVCERAVVREQQRAGRVDVEATDGNDTFGDANEVDDRWAPLRVAGRRDHGGGLVKQDVRKPLRGHRLAVDLDRVVRCDERVEPARLAVHADAPGLDQLVGGAPGRNSGPCKVRIQAHP